MATETDSQKLDRILAQLATMNNRLDSLDLRLARLEKAKPGGGNDDGEVPEDPPPPYKDIYMERLMKYQNDELCGKKPAEDKASADANFDPAAHVDYDESSTGHDAPEQKNITEPKSAILKSWACVNFSCMAGEELLKFLRSLARMCVNIGMDFSMEPTMLVNMSSPCSKGIVHGLWCVHKFCQKHKMKKGGTKFLLVILPEHRCSDEIIEEVCKDIGLVYQCCLPLSDRMAQKKYLKSVINGIKAKVIECNELSDSREDKDMAEDDNYEEMGEYDGNNCEEMGEDDCNSCYYEMRKANGSNDCFEMQEGDGYDYKEETREETLLLLAKDFKAINDGMLQAKSVDVIAWVCVNFSCISGKVLRRFLRNLGDMCASIEMDLSLEPTMLINMPPSRGADINASLVTVYEFMDYHGVGKRKAPVVIILPDDRYSHGDVKFLSGHLDLMHQLCFPRHVRSASKEYLRSVADKIQCKVLAGNTLSDSSDDMWEDDPEEFLFSFGKTGEDDYQQSSDDSDLEMGDYSHNESLRHDLSEKLAISDETPRVFTEPISQNPVIRL